MKNSSKTGGPTHGKESDILLPSSGLEKKGFGKEAHLMPYTRLTGIRGG